MERLLAALGVDAVQWRALTAAYVRMNMRRAGGPRRSGDTPREGFVAYRGVLAVTMLQGVMMTALTILFTLTLFTRRRSASLRVLRRKRRTTRGSWPRPRPRS